MSEANTNDLPADADRPDIIEGMEFGSCNDLEDHGGPTYDRQATRTSHALQQSITSQFIADATTGYNRWTGFVVASKGKDMDLSTAQGRGILKKGWDWLTGADQTWVYKVWIPERECRGRPWLGCTSNGVGSDPRILTYQDTYVAKDAKGVEDSFWTGKTARLKNMSEVVVAFADPINCYGPKIIEVVNKDPAPQKEGSSSGGGGGGGSREEWHAKSKEYAGRVLSSPEEQGYFLINPAPTSPEPGPCNEDGSMPEGQEKCTKRNRHDSRSLFPHTQNYRVSSAYGYRNHPVHRDRRFHGGIDLGYKGRNGVPLVSIANGVVSKVGSGSKSAGEYVEIYHGTIKGKRIHSRYVHMAVGGVSVTKGQQVKRGEVIGLGNNTGTSTGPHLHFEIRINGPVNNAFAGKRVNPQTIPPEYESISPDRIFYTDEEVESLGGTPALDRDFECSMDPTKCSSTLPEEDSADEGVPW